MTHTQLVHLLAYNPRARVAIARANHAARRAIEAQRLVARELRAVANCELMSTDLFDDAERSIDAVGRIDRALRDARALPGRLAAPKMRGRR